LNPKFAFDAAYPWRHFWQRDSLFVHQFDGPNSLALLKPEGKFSPLPVAASRGVKLGGTVATVGFPNIGLQGFAPKLAKGEIAALSGLRRAVVFHGVIFHEAHAPIDATRT